MKKSFRKKSFSKEKAPRVFKIPRPPTSESLANAALDYLSRFAASEASLRRVMENRIRRAALRNKEFGADIPSQEGLRCSIETIIERHKKSGGLNDKAYAETKINSLRRTGRSARMIMQKLTHAGVQKEIITDALLGNEAGLSAEEVELKAARQLLRKRRLGPFRSGATDAKRQQKDLAVLARAGFSFDIARRALGTDQRRRFENESSGDGGGI